MKELEKRPCWICPVCGEKLIRDSCSLLCGGRHCFDIAKSGYVNLIRSNKSLHGDNKEMIRARHAFLNSGHYGILRDALCDTVKAICGEGETVILDAGCGECYYTSAIANALPAASVFGVDLSKDALTIGGRRCHTLELAIASVNSLPVSNSSVDVITSVFAPMAADEFARVLKPSGALIRVVPLARHLYGMKRVLYDTLYENVEEHETPDGFKLINENQIQNLVHLTNDEIVSLFTMTPYYYRTGLSNREKLYALEELVTEIEFGILTYKKVKNGE